MTETVDAIQGLTRPTLAFVGAGRAGSALAQAFSEAGHHVVAVHSRTSAHAGSLAAATGARVVASAAAAMAAADVTFATVPDAEIARVAAAIAATGGALSGRSLVHCSATQGTEALEAARAAGARVGAFHPLQALAGVSSAHLLRGSSFVVEADDPLRATLLRLVADLGGHVLALAPSSRALYHAAAVLAGNAPLVLLARATSLLEEAGIDRASAHRALVALLAGAVHNAADGGPAGALTGPVVRGDAATVARHLEVLSGDPNARELYRRLSIEALSLAGPDGREAVADALVAAAPRRTRSTSTVVAHPRVA